MVCTKPRAVSAPAECRGRVVCGCGVGPGFMFGTLGMKVEHERERRQKLPHTSAVWEGMERVRERKEASTATKNKNAKASWQTQTCR